MPKRSTCSQALRAGLPVTIGPVTLLPIERVVLSADRGNSGIWFSAAKELYALIVRDAEGVRVVASDATTVSLDALREKVPELDAALGRM